MTFAGLKAPFVWWGGKSRAADLIWQRLGNPANFVEPFAGSLGVLLNRPHPPNIETVNDADGFICCTWRALAADPEKVAHYADWPSLENCLHARHVWLKARRATLTAQLEGDPDYYDAKIAGYWLWGIAQWIGSGWCSATEGGPWQVQDGQLVRVETDETGVHRKRPHLMTAGKGVTRQGLHLGDAGRGGLLEYFLALQQRLRRVRVCCGDWTRVMGPSVTWKNGLSAVLLDPPYSTEEDRDMNLYAQDSGTVAHDVRAWCLANGDNPLLRIALCGYGDVHDELLSQGWTKVAWKALGGYGNQGTGRGRTNSARETIWFNKHCLTPIQGQLFS